VVYPLRRRVHDRLYHTVGATTINVNAGRLGVSCRLLAAGVHFEVWHTEVGGVCGGGKTLSRLSRKFLSYFVWKLDIPTHFMHNAFISRKLSPQSEQFCWDYSIHGT